MKRALSLAVVTTAALAMAASTMTAPTATGQSTTTDDSTQAAAKKSPWKKVSKGKVSLINEPALYRTKDGVLHVAYVENGGADAVRWSNLSKRGKPAGHGTILSGWDSYSNNPKLVGTSSGGVRLVFGGIDADGPAPYNNNGLFTATAGSTGKDWALAPGAMLSTAPIATNGIGAVQAPGPPMVAVAFGDTLYWRSHDGSTAPVGPDNTVSNGDCCAYHTALAQPPKDYQVYFGWYSGGGSRHPGVFVRWQGPFSNGPKTKAPGSSRLDPDQTVALTGRRGAKGVYAAYCTGYPTCKKVKLWRAGTKKAITVPKSHNADTIAVAPAPGGRLWVTWEKNKGNRVFATRTNKSASRFGAVRTVKAPRRETYRISADATARALDVVINTGGELFHRRLLPGLRLRATPRRFHNNKRHVVTFKVTDAHRGVKGVQVRVAGKTKKTHANGTVKIAFRKNIRPKRYHVTAAKHGYAKAHTRVRVRR